MADELLDFMPPSLLEVAAERIDGGRPPRPTPESRRQERVQRLASAMRPFTVAELEAPPIPYPHLFEGPNGAMFPLRLVPVWAGAPRTRKTSTIKRIAIRGALGQDVGGMAPRRAFSTLILTWEDDREDGLEKLKAQTRELSSAERAQVAKRVRVVDMHADAGGEKLVQLFDNRANVNEALIEDLASAVELMIDSNDAPLGMIVIDTLGTGSEAPEDTVGHKVNADAAKRLAVRLGVAVVVVHHTSQASNLTQRSLNLSPDDVRGGTALIGNTRQTWMLLDLGCEEDGLEDSDPREVLRRRVAPNWPGTVTVVACLDSSKGAKPPPIFIGWDGLRSTELVLPSGLEGLHWAHLQRAVRGAKAEAKKDAVKAEGDADARQVAIIVERLTAEGVQATVSAVSQRFGGGKSGAFKPLGRALDLGIVRRSQEKVPRAGTCDVYRPMERP